MPDNFFVTGGTLPRDASSYVVRKADILLLEGLLASDFCYVLNTRQMGKSSLMVRTARRLREEGHRVVVLDLTAVGQNLTVDQWYFGLLSRLSIQLDREDELIDYWKSHRTLGSMQRFVEALRNLLLEEIGQQPRYRGMVIFVDEIDAVRSLPFSADEFFAGIRECYNRRAHEPVFNALTFCLLGVATPGDLIQDTRISPFNIGRRIDLRDFSEEESQHLGDGLSSDKKSGVIKLLKRIVHWTGGHPYMTQRLCRGLLDEIEAGRLPDNHLVDRVCERLFLSQAAQETDDNLMFVRNRLLRSEVDRVALLDMYQQVHRGKRVLYEETNPLCAVLRLSGVVKVEQQFLRVRNRVYNRVFDERWIRDQMPGAELRRQQRAFRQGALRATGVASALIAMVSWFAYRSYLAERKATYSAHQASLAEKRATQDRDQKADALYASQMLELQSAYEHKDLQHAKTLLALTKDYRYRGFEWNYWHRLLGGEKLSIAVPGPRSLMVWSRDDRYIATQSIEEDAVAPMLTLWDAHTGALVRKLSGRTVRVNGVRSPLGADRVALVQAPNGVSGKVMVYNPQTGEQLFSLAEPATEATLSGDGKRIFTLDPPQLVVASPSAAKERGAWIPQGGYSHFAVWDAGTGRKLGEDAIPGRNSFVFRADEGTVLSTPTSHRILFGKIGEVSNDTLTVYDTERCRILWQRRAGLDHSNSRWNCTGCALAPGGDKIAIGFQNVSNDIHFITRVYALTPEPPHKQEPGHILTEHPLWKATNRDVVSYYFSPDGKALFGLGGGLTDGNIYKWNTDTGKTQIDCFERPGNDSVYLDFMDAGRRLLIGSDGTKARIMNADVSGNRCPTLVTVSNDLNPPALSSDGSRFLAADVDHVVVYRSDYVPEEPYRKYETEGCSVMPSHIMTRFMKTPITPSKNGVSTASPPAECISATNLDTGQVKIFPLLYDYDRVHYKLRNRWWGYQTSTRQNGKTLEQRLVFQSLDGNMIYVKYYDVNKFNWQLHNNHAMYWEESGHWQIRDLADNRIIKYLGIEGGLITSACYQNAVSCTEARRQPDGRHLVHLYDWNTGQELWSFPRLVESDSVDGHVSQLIRVSEDNQYLAVLDDRGKINSVLTVYDRAMHVVLQRRNISQYWTDYPFSQDSRRIIFVDSKQQVHIFDLHDGSEIVWPPADGLIAQFYWSEEGDRVLTISFDGIATLRDTRTGSPLLSLHMDNTYNYTAYLDRYTMVLVESNDGQSKSEKRVAYVYRADHAQ